MFRLLGFPVHVRPGFVMFMVLIVVLYGDEFGVWLAGSLAVFTLLHELGHAVMARRTGARAEISLNFLAGYASYVPTRPITRLEQIAISLAGPGIQIVVSVAVLLAIGADPVDPSSFRHEPHALAIWWAGPVIGLFNLVPVIPLDGGSVVTTALDRILPGRAERLMGWFSIGVTAAFAVFAMFNERYVGFVLVIGFLLIAQLQVIGAGREVTSPWADADAALQRGRVGKARRTLTAALSTPRPDRTPAPSDLPAERVAALVDLLPDPLPSGDPWNEYVLANQLIRVGRFEDAAHYAAANYRQHPHALTAAVVARAAGALGDAGTAIGWLRAAAEIGNAPEALATVIDQAPELIGIRELPDVVAIRRSLTPPPAAHTTTWPIPNGPTSPR